MLKELLKLRKNIPKNHLEIIDKVWLQKDEYLHWPTQSLLLKPGAVRIKYHKYSEAEKALIKSHKVSPDTRSNGPAICSYLVAGGIRPERTDGKGWTVHHIYDGRFPFPGQDESSHAVKHPDLFSEAAGLVAAHPVADALADEFAYFAWLLRHEAYDRFAFDPDGVFSN